MSNPLSRRYGLFSLLKFTAPTIIMMVFMSLYTMVDGAFVSRFVGTSALSAINIVYPLQSIVIAVGIMLGTGGSAVIATQMGEKKQQEARNSFSLLVVCGVVVGVVIMVLGIVFLRPLVLLMGANEAIYGYSMQYLFILLLFTPMSMLQMLFQSFFVTSGKPVLGLVATVTGGVLNIVLDYIFIVPLGWGIAGAAIATGIGYCVPAVFGLVYFAWQRRGTLFFVRPRWNRRVLATSCFNGSSEMVTNLATAVTTYMFNLIMMRMLGEDGVAAITIVLYTQFFLTAVYLGYSSGIAPIISYNYGDGNTTQLRHIFRVSLGLVAGCSVATLLLCYPLSGVLVGMFAKDSPAVYELAHNGFLLFAYAYLFMGTNIFASSMFTALSNGKVSAIISFLRTFVFLIACVLLLPMAMGIGGVWLAVPLAELLTLVVSLTYIFVLRKKYGYG